jgi:RND family efflux transporter MFP subunit
MNADKRSKIIRVVALVVIFFAIYYFIHHAAKNNLPSLPTPVVIVQKPVKSSVTQYVTQTGNLVAYNSVNLVARVEGYLEQVKFTDGTFVKKGQELFVIEPEPYLEKLREAQAQLAAVKAASAYDQAEYLRQKQMYKENATSMKNVEKWLAKYEESKAEINKAIANVEIADINYSYTHVLAPFDGRIGRHLVDPGNLVGNGKATELATIEQIAPIYVYFNLNELDLIKIRTAARTQGVKPSDINKVPVYVGMQNETGYPHQGQLNFINTGLNSSTGTMEFRALLPNKNYTLLPGLFVQVRIPIGQPSLQLTIPDTAVQYDQIGAYLLVVDKNNKVILKRVTLGGVEEGMRTIQQGLDAQDNVIVNGLQGASPGMLVVPKIQNVKPS